MDPFNVFNKRYLRKIELYDPGCPEMEQTVEEYLHILDQFRFTTASPPLPLPLSTLPCDKDMEAADAIHQILALADADRSNMPRILPILTTQTEPIYRLAHQYKSIYGGPIQDTLVISMPLDKATGPQMSWSQCARDIQTRLSALTKFSFETDIPHNISRFDVEIRDDDRCFNPWREVFAPGDTLSSRYEDWAKVFYSGEQALRDFLKESLGDSFLDVCLELQRDKSRIFDQKAIVVDVLPYTQYGWARLRGKVLDLLQNFSAGIKSLVPPTFEVEFCPTHGNEAAKMRKETELKAITKKAPDLFVYDSVPIDMVHLSDAPGDDSEPNRKRQNGDGHQSHDIKVCSHVSSESRCFLAVFSAQDCSCVPRKFIDHVRRER